MSGREFTRRYVGRADRAHVALTLATCIVSGGTLTLLAAIPGVEETTQAARAVAGLNVTELLALICLASLGLSAFLIWTLLKNWKAGIEALTKISDNLNTRPCIAKEVRKD